MINSMERTHVPRQTHTDHRRLQPLEQCRHELLQRYPDCSVSVHSVDVASHDAVQSLAEQLTIEGNIDLLINCAGILRKGRVDSSVAVLPYVYF